MMCRKLSLAIIIAAVVGALAVAPNANAKKHKGKKAECMYKCPKHSGAKATWKAKCPKCGKKMCPVKKKKKDEKEKKAKSCCPGCPMGLKKDVAHLEKKMAHLKKKVKKLYHKMGAMHEKKADKKGEKDKHEGQCMKEKMKKMMKKVMGNMSHAEKMRHKILMKAEIKAVDPQALLVLKDKLGLDRKQVMRLHAIQDVTRNLVKETLEQEQLEKLEKLHGTPDSMKGLHKKMMKKMHK